MRPTVSSRSGSALANLAPVDQMRKILARERARSDRHGHDRPFSLITFQARLAEDQPQLFAELARILRARLRLTDDAGWLAPDMLGVVLSDTPASGAWKVADEVTAQLPGHMRSPIYQVFTYPWDESSPDETLPEIARLGEQERQQTHSLEPLFAVRVPLWKRGMDILGATAGLLAFSPLMLIIAFLIRRKSPGPVIFRQPRRGRGGVVFHMYKFRTMIVGADDLKEQLLDQNEQDGPAFKMEDDPRVTPIGKFLRKTSLDELPQLLNVLLGQMSLVGPRPLPLKEADRCLVWQRRRLDVNPGVTCNWQVEGRNRVPFDDWMRMDIQYLSHMRWWTDLQWLWRTVPAVLSRRGAK